MPEVWELGNQAEQEAMLRLLEKTVSSDEVVVKNEPVESTAEPKKKRGPKAAAVAETVSSAEDDQRKMVIKNLLKNLKSTYGDSIQLPGSVRSVIARISSGCETLNRVLGGGYPVGKIIEIAGIESAGKTSLAILAAALVQKNGGLVAFVDTEHALDSTWCSRLGFDLSQALFSQPDSGEQALDMIKSIASSGGVDLIIVDSVAGLSPQHEQDSDMAQNHMALQARMMSKAMRSLAPMANKSNTTIIFLNQFRSNLGSYGAPDVSTGGKALKYFSSVRLDVRKGEPIKEKELVVGHVIKVKTVKNKTAPPFAIGAFNFYYGNGEQSLLGVDYVSDLVTSAIELEIISKGGAWFNYGIEKFQGKANLVTWFKEDQLRIDDLKLKVDQNAILDFDPLGIEED